MMENRAPLSAAALANVNETPRGAAIVAANQGGLEKTVQMIVKELGA